MFTDKKDIESWLKKIGINNYSINDDLTVDVDGNVDLIGREINSMPVQFGKVYGDFNVDKNKLTSLKGCPEIVMGSFCCSLNNLTSLDYCPKRIGESFTCYKNQLTSLSGMPKKINCNFICSQNPIITFDGIAENIGGDLGMDNLEKNEEELLKFNTNVKGNLFSDFGFNDDFFNKVRQIKVNYEKSLLNIALNNDYEKRNIKKRI